MNSLQIAVAEGVFVEPAPVRFLGLELTSNMTVVQLPRGALLVHSPVALTIERRAAIDALGVVEHLYAPNTFHYLSLASWSEAYPRAQVHAPSALARKRAGLRIDRAHDRERAPEFEGLFDELPVRGFDLCETVLVHRASRTAICADIVQNIGRPEHRWTRMYSKMADFYDRVALSRVIRWFAFHDRREARNSVDAILSASFDRLVVGHGAPLTEKPREALSQAYQWLR